MQTQSQTKIKSKKKAVLPFTLGFIGIMTWVFLSNLSQNKNENQLFDQTLLQTASELNKKLPMMIDSETMLNSTIAVNNGFIYNYSLINYQLEDLDIKTLKEAISPQIYNMACSSPDLQIFRDKKIKMIYNYYDLDGDFITKVEVDTATCD